MINTSASFMYKLLFKKFTFKSQMFPAVLELLWDDLSCMPTLYPSPTGSPAQIIFTAEYIYTCIYTYMYIYIKIILLLRNSPPLVYINSCWLVSLFLTNVHPMG